MFFLLNFYFEMPKATSPTFDIVVFRIRFLLLNKKSNEKTFEIYFVHRQTGAVELSVRLFSNVLHYFEENVVFKK